MEVIASVESRESPIEAGLMTVMVGTELGNGGLTVRCHHRMQKRPKVRRNLLHQHRVIPSISQDNDPVPGV